ncbi:MAG TPA: hypothetical protein VNO75_06505 [Gemmatimonadaceae bacterium]|nr:hypothetical protein [Gemmatimonadaceae bacterium]
MTDPRGRAGPDPFSIVREIVRRSGHEIRNALSGISVNVEVVRSQIVRGGASPEVGSFAQRAARDVVNASALTSATLAIVDAVLKAAAQGTLRAESGYGAASEIEVMIYGNGVPAFAAEVKDLIKAIGVGVEERDESVILRVFPEDRSHSKN